MLQTEMCCSRFVPFCLEFFMMKVDIIVWNCQGVGILNFYRIVKEYIFEFDPAVVVLLKNRVSGYTAENVIKKNRFEIFAQG